jgi:hypothetical protein
MGDISGEAVTNTLAAQNLSQAELLVREGIQNSTDAAETDSDQKVKVAFRLVQLYGEQKEKFLTESLHSNDLKKRSGDLGMRPGNCIDEPGTGETPLNLLYIEDYGTHGIFGDPHSITSHFHKLLFSIADGGKARNGIGSGGSYGFGKAAYAGNSKIYTIFAYSRFNQKNIKDDVYSRYIGCGYFQGHSFEEKDYPGRCWLGVEDDKVKNKVHPFINECADNLALNAGFTPRDDNQFGTSLLLVDAEVIDIDELRWAIEKWWWPRLYENTLDVELYFNGQLMDPPMPRNNKELKPYIDCFDLVQGVTTATKKSMRLFPMRKIEQLVDVGKMACILIDEELAADDLLDDMMSRVALIRNNRMVINYEHVSPVSKAVGVYVADSNEYLNNVLKLSEPPSHTCWDSKTNRLNIKDDKQPGLAKEVVSKTLSNIKQNFRRFINDTADVSPSSELRPKVLENLLGNLFKSIDTSPGKISDKEVDPISVTNVQDYFEVLDEKLISHTSFNLSLTEKADEDSVEILLTISCQPKTDEGVDGLQIPVKILTNETNFVTLDELPRKIRFNLEKDKKILFKAESEPYDPNWSADLSISIERVIS